MSHDIIRVGSGALPANQKVEEPSKFKSFGFAIVIIFGLGGLAVAGVGVGGLLSAGSLTTLGQVNSIIMIAIGGAGGIPLLIIGIVGFVNRCSNNKIDLKNNKAAVQNTKQTNCEDSGVSRQQEKKTREERKELEESEEKKGTLAQRLVAEELARHKEKREKLTPEEHKEVEQLLKDEEIARIAEKEGRTPDSYINPQNPHKCMMYSLKKLDLNPKDFEDLLEGTYTTGQIGTWEAEGANVKFVPANRPSNQYIVYRNFIKNLQCSLGLTQEQLEGLTKGLEAEKGGRYQPEPELQRKARIERCKATLEKKVQKEEAEQASKKVEEKKKEQEELETARQKEEQKKKERAEADKKAIEVAAHQKIGPKDDEFVQVQEIVLHGHKERVEDITLHDNIIASCSKGAVTMWSTDTGKALDTIAESLFRWHHVTIEKNILVAVDNITVYVCAIENPHKILFKFDAFHDRSQPKLIAINGDIVASATGSTETSIQVWSCKTKSRLREFIIDARVKQIAIHKDNLVCVYYHKDKSREDEFVEVFSLQTGECLRKFSAETCAAVHENKVICVDNDKTSVYNQETGDCQDTFPQKIPYANKIVIYKDLLIVLEPRNLNKDNYTYFQSNVTIWSMVHGVCVQKFNLGKDWSGNDMNIVNDQLFICGLYYCWGKQEENPKVFKVDLLKLLDKIIGWPKTRHLYLGNKSQGSPFAQLPREILHSITHACSVLQDDFLPSESKQK